jgi:hypothetical protein
MGTVVYILLSLIAFSGRAEIFVDAPNSSVRFVNDGMWTRANSLYVLPLAGGWLRLGAKGGSYQAAVDLLPPWIDRYAPDDNEVLAWVEQQTFWNKNAGTSVVGFCPDFPDLPKSAWLDIPIRRDGWSYRYQRLNVAYGLVRCDGSPPEPASCQAYPPASIDFGTVDPKEISGKKATSQVIVWCDKKASVRVRFMTREGLAIFQMDNGLTTYLKIDDNPGTAGSYQTVAENASSPARAFNLSAELLGTSGSVKPGAFSYTAVVRVDIL